MRVRIDLCIQSFDLSLLKIGCYIQNSFWLTFEEFLLKILFIQNTCIAPHYNT